MPTFQALLPTGTLRSSSGGVFQCGHVFWNATSIYLCLFQEAFSSAIHPRTLCLLYICTYLFQSFIHSIIYIIQKSYPTSTSTSHDTASISTSNIYNHIQHPHPHPFQHPTSTSMHNICIQHPQPHPHLIWNIYTCIPHPHPHPYLKILYLFQHLGSISCFRPHHLPHFDLFIFTKWISFLPCYTMDSLEIAI